MSTPLLAPAPAPDSLTQRRAADARRGRISTAAAAEILGVDARTVRTWANAGRLTVVSQTLGGQTRSGWRTFDLDEVEALARLLRVARENAGETAPRWDVAPLAGWAPSAGASTTESP